MTRQTREQRDAEARNAAPRPQMPRGAVARGRILGKVLDDSETQRQMTIALAMPALFGHLLPAQAQYRIVDASGVVV